MSANDGGWDPGFPPVMHFLDPPNLYAKPWKLLEGHPDYEAAKNNEDRAAALRLVHDFLKTPENQALMRALRQKYPGAVVVPVHAIEALGKNRIPEALAEYIGERTGLEVDDTITQTNSVCRTGKDEWHRLAFRPKFDGEVKSGRNYVLVDDVFSNGGSFGELRLFIEKNGGKVVQTVAMSLGGHGDKIATDLAILNPLIDKYGGDALSFFLREVNLYDGNCKALTNPESFALRRAPSLDEARNRILAARQEGRAHMVPGSNQENEPETAPINSHVHQMHKGPRR
jgi:hypothetical protein